MCAELRWGYRDKKWSLIRYAGSATETSIDPEPIGNGFKDII